MATTKVTSKGREIAANRLIGTSPSQAEPKIVGWGQGTAASPTELTVTAGDVAPFSELPETRVTGTSSVVTGTQGTPSTNDTYQVVGTITATGTRTVNEAFLSDTTSKPTAVDSVQTSSGVIGSSSGTTVIVANGANFSANQFIQIRTEVMKITSIATNTLTVTRNQGQPPLGGGITTIVVGDTVTGGNQCGVTNVTNGNIFLHADFANIGLASGDSIQFTIQTEFQS